MAQFSHVRETEELLQILQQCHEQLDLWIAQSPANALLFLEDPAAAMKAAAAGSELNLAAMIELEAVLSGLGRKLELPLTQCTIDLDKAS